jgi:hypothetical protein
MRTSDRAPGWSTRAAFQLGHPCGLCIRVWTGIGVPRKLTVTVGFPVGNEQAMRLEFVIVAPPSIEPVAPTKPAVADSCDDRQNGTPAGPVRGALFADWLPPIVSA